MNANWIFNPDGSIYHLGLKKEDIADTILTVGDPERVSAISKYFDRIEKKINRREFVTHTGFIGHKRLTVISTGIGTDNIDIVLNEIDAIYQLNEPQHRSLNIIRVGTSGALQKEIDVDTLLVSEYAFGIDNLRLFYQIDGDQNLSTEFSTQVNIPSYTTHADEILLSLFSIEKFFKGNTLTSIGFYNPQGRETKLTNPTKDWLNKLHKVNLSIGKLTNLEMETSAIYGLGKLLGHRCISLNAILANRITNEFSSHPEKTIESMIKKCLEIVFDKIN